MDEESEEDLLRQWAALFRAQGAELGSEGDFGRTHLLNPAFFTLLGDVRGRHILDAGCGEGYLARLLAQRGAFVTGVEFSPQGYRLAVQEEQQTPLGIKYLQADLTHSFGMEDSFDIVVANMVFMDIPDYQAAIRHCIAAVRPGGQFIFSLLHPCFEEPSSVWPGQRFVAVREYLRPHKFEQDYTAGYHRPLSHYINFVITQGCQIQALIEPELTPSAAAENPVYDRNVHVPSYLLVATQRAKAS